MFRVCLGFFRGSLNIKRSDIITQLLNPPAGAGASLGGIRENLVGELEKPIKEIRQRFDAQRRDAEAIFGKKDAERKAIAAQCGKLRAEQGLPLRAKLERYRTETEWLWALPGASVKKTDPAASR